MAAFLAPAMGAFGSFIAMEAKSEFSKVLPSILQGAGNVIKSGVDYVFGAHSPKTSHNIGQTRFHSRQINHGQSKKKHRRIGR
jgi:hypothetical protein